MHLLRPLSVAWGDLCDCATGRNQDSVTLCAASATLEMLAQLLLLWCVHQMFPGLRPQLSVNIRCDNASAEAAALKGMSSVKALCAVMWRQRAWGIEALVEHIPGFANDLADLCLFDRMHPPVAMLMKPSQGLCLEPADASWPKHLRV